MPAGSAQAVRVYNVEGSFGRMAWYTRKGGAWHQVGEALRVNLGRNGVGKERERDGKTPVGVYPLEDVYGYEKVATRMPFFLATPSVVCVDDPKSRYYNRIVDAERVVKDYDSFEKMRRDDPLYSLVVTVGYNPRRVPGRGSCIFLHVANGSKPTAGCVAVPAETLRRLVAWRDPKARPVLVVEGR